MPGEEGDQPAVQNAQLQNNLEELPEGSNE
jgi:hypothetical protein